MTAVIYARFSSAKQNEASIDGQLRVCEEYAKSMKLKVIDKFIDRAATGTHDRRPAFRRMLKASSTGAFDYVIVYQYDRFARNRRDAMNNKYILQKNNVKLISATEPEINADRPADLFLEGMLDAAAEFFSRDLAQKTTRGMQESLNKGLSIGGITLFGYEVIERKYYVNERDARAVRFIFENFAAGDTVLNICDALNADNVKYRGREFKPKTVYDMIKNRKYIGEYINPFTKELITNMYPPIIDNNLFERVQLERQRKGEKLKMSTKYNKDRKYILTGKLKCGHCGENLSGYSGLSRDGVKYRYYRCTSPGCEKESIRKNVAEDLVVNDVYNYLENPVRKEFLVNDLIKKFNQAREDDGLAELEIEKKELQKELEKITSAYIGAANVIKRKLNERAEDLEEDIKNIDREILKIKFLHNEKLYDKEFLNNWITEVLNREHSEFRERSINYFVNVVYAWNDKLVTYLNFDNSEPLSHDQASLEVAENTKSEPHDNDSLNVSTSVLNGGPFQPQLETKVWINDNLMIALLRYTEKAT